MSEEVSVEVKTQEDNPFQANGELRRKADFIISHSRISRTAVEIVDPDSPQPTQDDDERVTLAPSSEKAEVISSSSDGRDEPVIAKVQTTNNTDNHLIHSSDSAKDVAGQNAVEAEVMKGRSSTTDNPQKAEQIKLKSKKRCSVQ